MPFYIGPQKWWKDKQNPNFYGKIATASVYNRVLTPQEITQNYDALKGRFGL